MEYNAVKDSGIRQEFQTGSVRDTQDGKPRYDLIAMHALRRLAMHYANGAVKYGDRNWEKGQPISRYFGSALRHIYAAFEGETDEDHLAAAAWNIFAIIETLHRIETRQLPGSLNDMPWAPKGQWNHCQRSILQHLHDQLTKPPHLATTTDEKSTEKSIRPWEELRNVEAE